jgi:hypothetical protein
MWFCEIANVQYVCIYRLNARITMEKYGKHPSLPGVSIPKSCSIKTEADSDSNMAAIHYHDLHCIKAESVSDTYMDGDRDNIVHCVIAETASDRNMDGHSSHKLHCIKSESGSDRNMDGHSSHELHCIKAESVSSTYMDDEMYHALHCIKTESGRDTNIAEFNTLATDCTKTEQASVVLDTKSSVLYIKSEPQDDAPVEYHHQNTSEYTHSEAVKTGSVQTVVHRAGDNNPNLLRMCDDNQTQSYEAHKAAWEGECLKHEHTSCEYTTPSASLSKVVDKDESYVTGDKPHKCEQCTK